MSGARKSRRDRGNRRHKSHREPLAKSSPRRHMCDTLNIYWAEALKCGLLIRRTAKGVAYTAEDDDGVRLRVWWNGQDTEKVELAMAERIRAQRQSD